jgi:hypothetical protein
MLILAWPSCCDTHFACRPPGDVPRGEGVPHAVRGETGVAQAGELQHAGPVPADRRLVVRVADPGDEQPLGDGAPAVPQGELRAQEVEDHLLARRRVAVQVVGQQLVPQRRRRLPLRGVAGLKR